MPPTAPQAAGKVVAPALGQGHEPAPAEIAFGEFHIDRDGFLWQDGTMVHLPPKELAALRLLVARAGHVVSFEQLREELWGATHVTADSIPKVISSLRTALKPDECIQTIYKRGYRFSAQVRPHVSSVSSPLPRLAIMPFATDFAVPEHLGMAIAEETSARLANRHRNAVAVMARDSVFTLARQGRTAQEVGQALKADLVLTGRLASLPFRFRLRAEMVRVEDGSQIWVEDILAPKERMNGLESEIADCLLYRLGGHGIGISAPADEDIIQNREAHEAFQKAHFEWQSFQRHQMQDGLQHLCRITEAAPSFMPAKVDLVNLCVLQSIYGFMSPAAAANLIRRTVDSVPENADRSALLPALGWVDFHWDRDLPAALSAFSACSHMQHDPSYVRERTMFEMSRHRFSEAIAMFRAALSLDPYSPLLQSKLAWALHLAGRADEAADQIRRALALFPDQGVVQLYSAILLAYYDEAGKAVSLASDLVRRLPFFDVAFAVQAYAMARAGRKDEASSILERLQWLSRERFVMRSFSAAAYLAVGDREAALAELRVADETRCPWFFQMLADPRMAALEGDPEFVAMKSILAKTEAAAG